MREELELMAAELRSLHAKKNKLYAALERITIVIARKQKAYDYEQRRALYDRRADEILANLTQADIKALRDRLSQR